MILPSIWAVINALKKDETSKINKFFQLKIPNSDYDYIKMWEIYMEVVAAKGQQLNYPFKSRAYGKDNQKLKFDIPFYTNIQKLIDLELKRKIKKITFEPLLEKYLKRFDENEIDVVRQIIISFAILLNQDDILYKSIIEVSQDFFIDNRYVLSLSVDHHLIQDCVIEKRDSGLSDGKSFLHKEFNLNSSFYKLVIGSRLSNLDKLNFSNHPLREFFGVEKIKTYEESDKITYSAQDFDFEKIDDLFSEENEEFEKYSTKEESDEKIKKNELEANEKEDFFKEEEIVAFEDDLDYLNSQHLWISELEKISKEKYDSIIREADDTKIYSYEQKMQYLKNNSKLRLKKTEEAGFTPRLERISRKLKLSETEKDIIKVLTVRKVFIPEDHGIVDDNIGSILRLLIDDPQQRVRERKIFLKNSKLIKYHLIQVSKLGLLGDNFYDSRVTIDTRLVEYFQGHDFQLSEYLDGTVLYKPVVKLDDVILDKSIKNSILELIENFPKYIKLRKNLRFAESIDRGKSVALLFVGPSGTGKTMLANAVANRFSKRILSINLNSRLGGIPYEDDNIISFVFREARINDAILFFDESELLLRERIPTLLTELENHEGIVIFATNADFRFDEAMKRRIYLTCRFHEPSALQRKQIWQLHLPENIEIAKDLDLDVISRQFVLNGGLIKNAVFTAILKAVNDGSEKIILKNSHVIEAAKEQLSNKLFMSKTQRDIVPKRTLEDIIVSEKNRMNLLEIINFERSRNILENEWGFEEKFPYKQGIVSLFHGPSGTGKTLAAEVIARETGKSLRQMNYSQIVSMYVGETEKNLEAILQEGNDEKSIILFDEAEGLFSSRTNVSSSTDKYANLQTDTLLSLIENNNLFVILTTNHIDLIDKSFMRRIKFIVEFDQPDSNSRLELWNVLTPNKLPLAEDVNYVELANRYPFNGGDIKNILIRVASRKAITYTNGEVISQSEFIDGCDEYFEIKNAKNKLGF